MNRVKLWEQVNKKYREFKNQPYPPSSEVHSGQIRAIFDVLCDRIAELEEQVFRLTQNY